MSQSYYCNECGEQQPTIFQTFLHCMTFHMGMNIALAPYESRTLLRDCGEFNQAFWDFVRDAIKDGSWGRSN